MNSVAPHQLAIWRAALVCLQLALPIAWRESEAAESKSKSKARERRDLLVTSVLTTLRLTLEHCDAMAVHEEALVLVYLLLDLLRQRQCGGAAVALNRSLSRPQPQTLTQRQSQKQSQSVHEEVEVDADAAFGASAIDDFKLDVLLTRIAIARGDRASDSDSESELNGALSTLAAECLFALVECRSLVSLMFTSACRRSDAAWVRFALDVLRFDPSSSAFLTAQQVVASGSNNEGEGARPHPHSNTNSNDRGPLVFAIEAARSEAAACAVAKLLLERRVDPTHLPDAFQLCVRKEYHTLASIVVAHSPFILGIRVLTSTSKI